MDAQILGLAYAVITGLLTILLLLIGWLGKTTMGKIDRLTDSINTLNSDLHGRLNAHDKRITWVEIYIDRIKDRA